MKVKVVLSIGDKLVKGNILKCEGDEIVIDIGSEQYAPLVIKDGVVTAWSPHKEKESCFSCAQIFEKDSMILVAYGLLFCSIDCVQKKFPDTDLNYVEEILASDIGVE